MDTTPFCCNYRLTYRFPLPPVRKIGNSLTFSSSLNTRPLFPNPKNRCSVRGRSSSKATSFSPSSSSSVMRITCGKVREIKESEFPDVVLKSNRPVLVEFVATWCGPCRLIASAVESLAQEYEEKLTVVKIDHDSNPRLIEEYKVYGLPTLILFKNGKEVPGSKREGAITEVKLKEYVDGLLESVSIA
ncbi:hypothetical protein ACH5RR_036734 [Cinchona calisaya]|uniref:Thioredoxin domain-containing protein n=1 Tax=Cinchona calisaya TaxID=153742 RepID=A0ABD2Y8Z5_9GENT